MGHDAEDDYGRRRDADFQYAGGVQEPQPKGIEKFLLASGMPKDEVPETAGAIVKLMEKMRNDPSAAQLKMVDTFMGRYANPDAVVGITKLALEEVKEKHAFTLKPQGGGTAPTIAPPAPRMKT